MTQESGPGGTVLEHPASTSTGSPAGSPVDQPVSQPVDQHIDQPVSQPVSQPVGQHVPSAPATAGETSQPLASYGVAGQVFGEVGRLVSRGDGTRRITLNLQPEVLGEVRVILTVRGGEVHVRMTGGDLAQQALLQGAPELHRLLDSVGATTSRVVVGDAGSTFQQNSFTTPQDGRRPADQYLGGTTDQHHAEHHAGHHDAQQHDAQQHDAQQHSHRGAGTRLGDTSARDGSAAGSVRPHLPPDPGTRTRTGVDVTM